MGSSLILDETSPFHDLLKPARYKIYYGGRDSAKSWSFAEAAVRRMAREPIRLLCVREYQTSIKDSVHKLLKDTIARLGLESWFTITLTEIRSKCGAEAIFKGLHNNVDEIKSTEGVDIVWVEEAHNTSEDSWTILIPTIRKEGSEIWVSFNVTDVNTPTHKRFVTNCPPNAIRHHVNFDKNPFLSETSKNEIAYLKEVDYHAYEHVYLGMPKELDDSVIFAGKYRVEAFPEDLWKQADRLHYGLDHGFAIDPYAFTRSFILKRRLYIEYEAFGYKTEFAGKMAPGLTHNAPERGELEQLLDSIPEARKWPIKADSSRPETISFLRGKGFQVSAAEKWKGCVEDGVSHLKGFEVIVIHDRCKHMQQEARLYSFKRDRVTGEILPVIIDANNHGWDSVRYGLDGHIRRSGDLGIWQALGRQAGGLNAQH